jgi:phosphoenolpyruvate carboxylase
MATKTKQVKFSDKNFMEAPARDIIDGVINSAKNDLVRDGISAAWKSLLTSAEKTDKKASQMQAMSGDLQEGEEISLSRSERRVDIDPGIDYKEEILHFERKTTHVQQGQLNQRVEQIMAELKQLSQSVKSLETQVRDVDMNMVPQAVGKYHETFFEFLLTNLRSARTRIEDSSNWLNAISKKASRKGYWGNAKKHGTSYTLSADRAVSQQVG